VCGIAGMIDFENEPIDPTALLRMSQSIAHRGPDDDGPWSDGRHCELGFRRLQFLTCLLPGQQPCGQKSSTLSCAVLATPCLDQRVGDQATGCRMIAAWGDPEKCGQGHGQLALDHCQGAA
jgi:hypothetical protein